MCGIAGVITEKIDHKYSFSEEFENSLDHRGPDAKQYYSDNSALIFHSRLAINGLESGDQPFIDQRSGIILFANAEIYNHRDLRKKYDLRLSNFGKNDCEVLLPLYLKLGDDFLRELVGMFSLVIWHPQTQTLKFARDRVGEKPMYYFLSSSRLIFSSELRSLVKALKGDITLDASSIVNFLRLQFIPEPYTAFNEIKKVPAGSLLTYTRLTSSITIARYWNGFTVQQEKQEPKSFGEVLEKSVIDATLSDVPIAIALSGGIDSSIIAGIVTRSGQQPNGSSFTVGYETTGSWDESHDAASFAKSIGLKHEQIVVTDQTFIELLPRVCGFRDDPIADFSGVPQYCLANHVANRGFKVLLHGLAADELTWGYPWVREYGLALLTQEPHGTPKQEAQIAIEFFKKQPFCHWMDEHLSLLAPSINDHRDKANLILDNFLPEKRPIESTDIIKLMCTTYLVSNGITQSERLGMSNSVEVRLPFVNHHFIEKCLTLARTDNSPSTPKKLLKAYLMENFPNLNINKPKKGFSPPAHKWSRLLVQNYYERLIDGYLVKENVISKLAIENLLATPKSAVEYTALRILISLELWWQALQDH